MQSLLAALVHDLSKELTLDDLETQLPYSADELKDTLELLKIPDGLEAYLEEEANRQERERPTVLSFVIDGNDAGVVEQAIAKAKETGGTTRGQALIVICQAYVGNNRSRNGGRE